MGQLILLLLFLTGLMMVIVNAYWFVKGVSVVEPIRVTLTDPVPKQPLKPEIPSKMKPVDCVPKHGDQYAHLLIPKLDAKIPIYYGSKEAQLKQGIGHVERTALPGEPNNTVLSGHRDTVFRHLGKIEKGDRFIVETEKERFTYLVKKIRIVDKDDRTVIVPKPKATLTVITCYPFGYAGKAPKRFVVMAELINGS